MLIHPNMKNYFQRFHSGFLKTSFRILVPGILFLTLDLIYLIQNLEYKYKGKKKGGKRILTTIIKSQLRYIFFVDLITLKESVSHLITLFYYKWHDIMRWFSSASHVKYICKTIICNRRNLSSWIGRQRKIGWQQIRMAEKEIELTSRTDVWHDDVHHGFFFQELCFEGKQEYFVGDGKFVWQDFLSGRDDRLI